MPSRVWASVQSALPALRYQPSVVILSIPYWREVNWDGEVDEHFHRYGLNRPA